MKRVLVLLTHPNLSQSKANQPMADAASAMEGVTLVDLYALYPRFKINVEMEQQQLLEHDVIVLQFPFYWYSTPALLKEWQDLVLEHGFAYGTAGNKLAGKSLLVATTAGGAAGAYASKGSNQFPIRTLLSPLEQTAALCQMRFLPPLVLFSSLAASQDERIAMHVRHYKTVLEALQRDSLDMQSLASSELLDPLTFSQSVATDPSRTG